MTRKRTVLTLWAPTNCTSKCHGHFQVWEECLEKYFAWLDRVSIQISLTPLNNNLCCPVGWGCRIHRLLLCRRMRPLPHNECPGYDTKQSDGEVPVMLELWGMQSTPLLQSPSGPLWPGVVAPDKALSIG